MFFNCEKITTFREVFDYINYDWDHLYTLTKNKDGVFSVNKLCIGKNFVQYKMDCHELAEGLYERVSQLYDLMQETPREANEDAYNQLISWIQERVDSDSASSFSLEKVPLEEREKLVNHFEKNGYRSYLYMDHKSIMVQKKEA
jgi:hypothetical protein